MKAKCLTVLAVALVLAGCAGLPPDAVDDSVTVQVEELTLTGAKVIKVPEAGGGKVVVLEGSSSKAEGNVTLKKGAYYVTVFALAVSDDEDAFYIQLAGGYNDRLYSDEKGAIVPVDVGRHTQAADGACKIVFGFGEENVQLDQILFERIEAR